MAVAGCAAHKGLSSADRLKIESDLTYLESFLLAKEQTSSNIHWQSVAEDIASARKSYDTCSSTYGHSILSQVLNANNQLHKDISDINERIGALESYMRSLPQKHLSFVHIDRLNTIKSRFRTYTSSQKEALNYAINVLDTYFFSTDCQEILSSRSFSYPLISPQLLCESVPMGMQKDHSRLVAWFRSNLHLLNKDSIAQLEKDEGIALDLGTGRVVMVNEIISNSDGQNILLVEPATPLPVSVLFIAANEQEPYLSNPSLWKGKTCQLKGEIIEIQRNHLTGCLITLDSTYGYDFSDLCLL